MGGVERILIDDPIIGSKGWLLEDKGIYVLEEGPGLIRCMACTHAGSGGVIVYDGLPDENGYFPHEAMPKDDPNYNRRNGRLLYRAMPTIMGMWMFDVGFTHGLTVRADGGHASANSVATIVWNRYKQAVRR